MVEDREGPQPPLRLGRRLLVWIVASSSLLELSVQALFEWRRGHAFEGTFLTAATIVVGLAAIAVERYKVEARA